VVLDREVSPRRAASLATSAGSTSIRRAALVAARSAYVTEARAEDGDGAHRRDTEVGASRAPSPVGWPPMSTRPQQVVLDVAALRGALHGLVDQFVDNLIARATAPEPPEHERIYMNVTDYARARGYSPGAITKWANLGMPHLGEGKARRIRVRQADVWISDGGPSKAARKAGMKADGRR